jgi:hypothetical protein
MKVKNMCIKANYINIRAAILQLLTLISLHIACLARHEHLTPLRRKECGDLLHILIYLQISRSSSTSSSSKVHPRDSKFHKYHC